MQLKTNLPQFNDDKVLIDLDDPFVDERGEVIPLLNIDMQSCVLINSKAGTVRANHYHKTDWHYCYVLEGEIDYYHRPVGDKNKAGKVTISKGQMFYTGPMIEPTMVFITDTIFLTFGKNKRHQEVYEADIVRIDPLHLQK